MFFPNMDLTKITEEELYDRLVKAKRMKNHGFDTSNHILVTQCDVIIDAIQLEAENRRLAARKKEMERKNISEPTEINFDWKEDK